MERLTKEEEQELIRMYEQVERDFEEFPEIKTTEDLFRWREDVKRDNKGDGELRNQIIENRIKGNKSMELLYAWSKFSRMIDRTRANVVITKLECDAKDDAYKVNPTTILHECLTRKNKAHTNRLFGIYKIRELNLGIKYPTERSFQTPYEYEKALITEDDERSWPAVLFVALMNAYGIEEEDLLEAGRKTEQKGKEYIADLRVEYEAKILEKIANSTKTYTKK